MDNLLKIQCPKGTFKLKEKKKKETLANFERQS